MKYWVWSNNKASGPYSAEELGKQSDVGPKTLIRRAGAADEGDWTPLEKMPILMQFLSEAWAKDGPPPPPPLLCWKCGSGVDGDATYCDQCGSPDPLVRPLPEAEPLEAGTAARSIGRAVVDSSDVGPLIGTALLVVGGFVGLGMLSSDDGNQQAPRVAVSATEHVLVVPTVEYANEFIKETLELRNFRWNEYGELAFEVHFKGNFAERGTLRFEIFDERGVVIYSGEAGSFSGGANKKVFEARIPLASERRRRARRIVFDF